MQQGQAQLKKQHEKMGIDKVDKLVDDIADLQADMRDVTEALVFQSRALADR